MPKDAAPLVWLARLKGKYSITVIRTALHSGELAIAEDENILHRESVDLGFDALSGPDIPDVIVWHEIAIRVVDKLKRL
jgi:hypothetical protein